MGKMDFTMFPEASSDKSALRPLTGEVISDYGYNGQVSSLNNSALPHASGIGGAAVALIPVLDTAIKSVASIINTALVCSAEVRKVSIQERELTKRVEAQCERDIALAKEQTRQVAIQEREKTKRFYMEVALKCQEMEQHLKELKLQYQNEERNMELDHIEFMESLGNLSELRIQLSKALERHLDDLSSCTDKEERINIRENVVLMSKELIDLAKTIVTLQESGG